LASPSDRSFNRSVMAGNAADGAFRIGAASWSGGV
jgi:hypothetical protein